MDSQYSYRDSNCEKDTGLLLEIAGQMALDTLQIVCKFHPLWRDNFWDR